jgi:hypothetical protein
MKAHFCDAHHILKATITLICSHGGLDALEGPNGDAHMRKNTSFAVAAIALVFTIAFCAWSNVVAISPDMLRPQAGMPYGADVGSFLPIKRIEPAW